MENINQHILTGLRILAGLVFLYTGYFHFANYTVMAVYVPLPVGAKYFVLLVATLISMCSVAVILGKETRAAFLTLAIINAVTGLMILIPTIHLSNDVYLKMIQIPNLYKLVVAFVILLALIGFKPKKQ